MKITIDKKVERIIPIETTKERQTLESESIAKSETEIT